MIVHTELNLRDVKLTKAIRLGKKQENRSRLMLVSLEDATVRGTILENARKLRTSDTWGNVYISPDLTPKERVEGKKL